MQRVACITQKPTFLPSFSGIRHNSTEVPLKRTGTVKRTVRVPVVRLGGVVIPSVEEVRAKAAAALKPSYAADISYLDNASNHYLSAKLARLGRREATKEETPKGNLPNKVPQPTPVQIPFKAPQPTLTPEDIAALTAKRREDRKMRVADEAYHHLLNYVPVPEKSKLLRSEFAKSNVFTSPARNPSRGRANIPRRPPQVRGAERDQQGASPPWKDRPRMQTRTRAPVARATQSVTPPIDEEIDETIFQIGGYEPEFNGPEPPSNLLKHFGLSFSAKEVTVLSQSGTAVKIPVSKVDSFYKSDYSRYVSASNGDYASPPNTLGAVKVAERTLSHQRHYNLTARDRTLELVSQASQVSKPVAKLPVN